MEIPDVPPMPEGCPWSGWVPPNVDWCEEQLCSWITNPAGTWSNLAYLIFGIAMIVEARRAKGTAKGELALFGPASIAVGVFSFVYHASYTFFLQFFDFVGMFLFCFTVLSENALRLGWIRTARKATFFFAGVASFSGLVLVLWQLGLPYQGLVLVLILVAVGQELLAWRKHGPASGYGIYATGLGLLVVAASFSLADLTRTWCDPSNHWLQGHAIWHVLTAAALYAFFRFYGQLPRRGAPDLG